MSAPGPERRGRALGLACVGLALAAALLWGASATVWFRATPAGRAPVVADGAAVMPSLTGVALLALAGVAAVVATAGLFRRAVACLLGSRTASTSDSTLGAVAGAAPARTTVNSPRISPSAAHAASSANDPRRTSSCVFVSSRHTAAARSPPSTVTASARVSATRCGDSKNTTARNSVRNVVSQRRRSPGRRGANPSKQNRSAGSPDSTSAVVTAEGPGRQVTGSPSAAAAATMRYPGSDTAGIPASLTTSTVRPARTSSSRPGSRATSTAS